MPRIFDNINELLSDSLCKSLAAARRADFCVGYFNLRGWKLLAPHIDHFESGDNRQCRLLVGMPVNPELELQSAMSALPPERIDNRLAVERRKVLAEAFRRQLCYGVPTDADEAGLRWLCHQLRTDCCRSSSLPATPCMPSYISPFATMPTVRPSAMSAAVT